MDIILMGPDGNESFMRIGISFNMLKLAVFV